MGIDIPALSFDQNDIGANLRRKTPLPVFIRNPVDNKTIHYSLRLNVHEEYNFFLEDRWYESAYHHIFYDNKTIILEAYFNEITNSLVINALTTIQINLFFNIDVDECIIKSESPVCVDGCFKTKTILAISAPSLFLLDDIKCIGSSIFKLKQGCGLLGNLKSNDLDVHTSFFYQSANINAEKFDLSAEIIQHIEGFQTQAKILSFISESCDISGDFQVDTRCFITANMLSMGTEHSSININLLGDNHIHFIHGSTQGAVKLTIGHLNENNKIQSNFFCDREFYIHSLSAIVFKNTKITVPWLKNEGALSIESCLFDVFTLIQEHHFNTLTSNLLINQYLQNKKSKTLLSDSELLSHSTIIDDGIFLIENSSWKTETIYIRQGVLKIENNDLIEINNSLITEFDSQVSIRNNPINVKIMNILGSIDFKDSHLNTQYLISNQNTIIEHSIINAIIHIKIEGKAKLHASDINASLVHLKGLIHTHELLVYADQFSCFGEKVRIDQSIVNSNTILLEAGNLKKEIIISNGQLATKKFSIKNNVKVINSILIGFDKSDMAHDIQGKLILNNTRWITESQIHHLIKKQHLLLLENSEIKAHYFFAEAMIVSKHSKIRSEHFYQSNGLLYLEMSQLNIAHEFSLYQTNTIMQESNVYAEKMSIGQTSSMRLKTTSALITSQEIFTDPGSELSSENSMLQTTKFLMFGRSELCSSLLSAEELFIYEQFRATNTIIKVEDRILLAQKSKAKFIGSQIESKNMHNMGHIKTIKSNFKLQEQLGLWSNSTTLLSHGTTINADHTILRGTLEIKKEDLENEDRTYPVQLQIQKQLDISPIGKIFGDEDLIIDAPMINQRGIINLSSNFYTKGRQFDNLGNVTAESITLGFDDAIVNHGLFSSKNMVVHGNFMNLFGQVYAQQSLSCSGFVSINSGIIAANNYCNDTFLSLNSGLIVPNFSADPNYIFSTSNLISVAKTTALMTMPGYSNSIQLIGMIPGLISAVNNIYSISNRLDIESLKNLRRHELMPLLCQIKNIVLFGKGAFEISTKFMDEIKIWDASLDKFINKPEEWFDDAWNSLEKTDWQKLSTNAASAFAGSYNDSSLVHLNLGGSFVGNTSKSSFMHINQGIEASLFSHNINTQNLYNGGLSIGQEASFLAQNIENYGTLNGTSQFTIKAETVDNEGILTGQHAYFEIKELQQNNELNVLQGYLKVNDLKDTLDAKTNISDAVIEGKTLTQQGSFNLDNVYVKEEEHFLASNTAQSETNNVMIETKDYEYSGKLNYEGAYTIKAETVLLDKSSVITGKKTADDELFVPKTRTDEASHQPNEEETPKDKEPEKEFKPEHVFSISGDKITINGTLSGGDYTQIQGQDNSDDATNTTKDTKETPQTEVLIIGDSANIALKYGSIDAKKSVLSGCNITLDNFSLKIEQNTIDEHASMNLKNSSYTGNALSSKGNLNYEHVNVELKQWQHEGDLTVDKSYLKVDAFEDVYHAHVTLSDSTIEGKTLDQHGAFTLNNTYIKEDEHYIASSTAESKTNNVMFETKEYTNAGKVDYEGSYTVNAETILLEKDSIFTGKMTAENDLFVAKEKTDETTKTPSDEASNDTKTEDQKDEDKEPEKDFKPQHILNLSANKITLNGTLKVNDYTQIQGRSITGEDKDTNETKDIPQTELLIIGDSANIDLKYGFINAKEADFAGGNTILDNFNAQIQKNTIEELGSLTLKKSNYKGDSFNSKGFLKLDHANLNATDVHFEKIGKEVLLNSNITSSQLIDESQMSYQGQSGIITDDYQHTGHVQKIMPTDDTSEKNLFYVEAKTAELNGSADLDNAYFSIDELIGKNWAHGSSSQKHILNYNEADLFASGQGKYSLYTTNESLTFITKDACRLSLPINRDCDLWIQASEISCSTNYNKQHDLTLVSTVGNINLTGSIQAKNFYAKSAKDIMMNHVIDVSDVVSFESEGTFYNYGGMINGNDVSIKAYEIKNITRGANLSLPNALPIGDTGIINARKNLFLESTKGNIENYGGVLRGGEYAQLISAENVLNLCNVRTYQGRYDVQKEFDGGLIAGGNGANTEDVGLYIKAQNEVISDASDFISEGANYIEGVNGVHFNARQHTFISKDKEDKTWYGKKTHTIETSTTIRGSVVHSNGGRNIIKSEEGSVNSVATRFSSPGGTDVYAKGNVCLFSLKAQNHQYASKSYFWGLTTKERNTLYETSTPTLFYDNGVTRIQSTQGCVDARGAYFIGNGDLSIQAKGRIQLGVDILNYEIEEISRVFDWSAPGKNVWDLYQQGASAWNIATAEDATLAKINAMAHGKNVVESMANASNLGIDLANTTNCLMRGLSHDTLSNELMGRYGLGGAHGFSPALSVRLTETKSKTTFQTQSKGGINRGGNVKLESEEGVDLENGVQIHAGGNLEIDAPELLAHAAVLNTNTQQTKFSQNISIAPMSGQMQSVGISYSKTTTAATNYVNAELSADGNISLHHKDKAMNTVMLDGANIKAKTLDANIDKLIINDKQDYSKTKTKSYSIQSTGLFSAYQGKGYEKVTNHTSGIHVTEGINTDEHHVTVNETYMQGGAITTERENNFTTNKLVATSLKDERHYQGLGISGNINDINRFKDDGKPKNTVGEQTIATATIMMDKIDYVATSTPVIYGEKETNIDVNELVGEVHTGSANGKTIQQNNNYHVQLDAPITNKAYLEQSLQNIESGQKKLNDIFFPEPKDKESMAFNRSKPIRPVRESQEENNDADDPKKKKKAHDSKIASEDMEKILKKGIKNIKFESPEKEKVFRKTLATAEKEKKTTGSISPQTEKRLKEQLAEAFIKTLKSSKEAEFDHMLDALGPEYKKTIINQLSDPDTYSHAGIKSYISGKSMVFSFSFNLSLSAIDESVKTDDLLKHSVVLTTVDIAVDIVMKVTMGEFAGPISWGLNIISIADSFYSEEQVKHWKQDGAINLIDGAKEFIKGNYWDGFMTAEKGALKLEGAMVMEGVHQVANVTNPIINKVESFFSDKKQNRPASPSKERAAKMYFFAKDEVMLDELKDIEFKAKQTSRL